MANRKRIDPDTAIAEYANDIRLDFVAAVSRFMRSATDEELLALQRKLLRLIAERPEQKEE